MCIEGRLCEETRRRQPPASQGKRLRGNSPGQHLDLKLQAPELGEPPLLLCKPPVHPLLTLPALCGTSHLLVSHVKYREPGSVGATVLSHTCSKAESSLPSSRGCASLHLTLGRWSARSLPQPTKTWVSILALAFSWRVAFSWQTQSLSLPFLISREGIETPTPHGSGQVGNRMNRGKARTRKALGELGIS